MQRYVPMAHMSDFYMNMSQPFQKAPGARQRHRISGEPKIPVKPPLASWTQSNIWLVVTGTMEF